jgi:hypothetical protein
MNKLSKILLLIAALFSFQSLINAQSITITPIDLTRQYDGTGNTARIDFVSLSPNLLIEENAGTPVLAPQKREDGKYVYTCICDVNDTNKFIFNITEKGSVDKVEWQVKRITKNQYFEYEIEVVGIEVKILNNFQVVPVANTARAFITSNSNHLEIESLTGEKAEGPVLNANNSFDYTVSFDLTTPESRNIPRSLKFKVDASMASIDLGTLSPKQGVDIAVIVLASSCYPQIINHARQSFLSGNYKEAYDTYQQALQDTSCPDKPQDTSEDSRKMEEQRKLAISIQNGDALFKKAEGFVAQNQIDSAMYYHAEARKFRNFILKANPGDDHVLAQENQYQAFKQRAGRQVSGRVLNNALMDMQGNNLPIEGAYVVLTTHKRDSKKVNGVDVPKAGDEKGKSQLLGQSDAQGNFTVFVPRNTKDTLYQLNFTVDETAIGKSYGFQYLPKDADLETNVIVKLTPKKLN